MDNQNEREPGEQPAATTAAPTGEQPSTGNPPSTLDSIDSKTLLAAMEAAENGTPEEAEPAAPAAAPQAPAEVVAEEPAATEEPAPTLETETPKGPQRLSVRSLPADQQVELAAALDMVRRGEAPDIKTALGVLAPAPAQADQAPTEQPAPPAPKVNAKVAEIQSRIDDLRAQQDQADDDFDRPKYRQLNKEIQDLGLELIRAENAALIEAAQNQSYSERFAAAADAVEETYPDLKDETSDFSQLLDDRITAAKSRNDPALKDPNFIKAFAEQLATQLGITKGATTTTATPAPAKPSRPVGSGLAPGNQTAARPTREQLEKEIQTMPIDKLRELVCTE